MDEIEMRLAAMERAITAVAQLARPAQFSALYETSGEKREARQPTTW